MMLRCLHFISWSYFAALTALLLSPDFSEPLRRGIAGENYTHVVVFGILGLLSELGRRKKTFAFWTVFLCVYAIGSEVLQGLMNPICHRVFDMNDLVQDCAGVQIGMVIGWVCNLCFNVKKDD
jgi:hypothetical protein